MLPRADARRKLIVSEVDVHQEGRDGLPFYQIATIEKSGKGNQYNALAVDILKHKSENQGMGNTGMTVLFASIEERDQFFDVLDTSLATWRARFK